MKRLFDRRVGFSLGAVGLLFATMTPALIPAFASAATITSRSIQMSTAAASATGVSYQLSFTPGTASATDMLVYFCSNTPLSSTGCTAPTGFSLASATVTAGTGTAGAVLDTTDTGNPGGTNHNVIAIKGMSMPASADTLTINNVTNPSASGTFYARIQTYAANATQEAAWSNTSGGAVNGDLTNTYTDNGSVALSTNNTLGVQASVLESLSFCLFGDAGNLNSTTGNQASDSSSYLSGNSATPAGTINTSNNLYDMGFLTHSTVTNQGPGSNCSDSTAATYAGGTSASNGFVTPNVTLGQYVASGIYALNTANVSYAADWTQISTNANGGATVYLKSSNTCGASAGTSTGLSMNGDTSCGIPGTSSGLTAGTAGVGVALGTPVNLDATTTSDGAITLGSTYNNGSPVYALPGATSGTYGGSLYTTTSAPAANWDVPVGLGATISNNTPAGNYSDNLNLIAVGTF